jgi:plastocyanin
MKEVDFMERTFTISGAEALLAIAACERITTLTGHSETNPGHNVTFAYGKVGRLFPLDMEDFSWRDAPDANLTVQVQRVLTRPGIYRYQCTIQPDGKGVLS